MNDFPVMVVTGTSRGVGRGIAEHFIAKGYNVFGCSRGAAAVESERYHHALVDIGDESQVRKWIRSVKEETSNRIDVLVSNAGLVKSALQMVVTSGNVVEDIIRSNFIGSYYVCREVAKVMVLKRCGRIITMSSIMTCIHEPGTSVYSASKSAVVEMTKVLAREIAPLGITCNAIAPAMISNEASEAFGEAWTVRMLEKQTIKRKITIEEICHVISFFISPESSSITGEIMHMGLVS